MSSLDKISHYFPLNGTHAEQLQFVADSDIDNKVKDELKELTQLELMCRVCGFSSDVALTIIEGKPPDEGLSEDLCHYLVTLGLNHAYSDKKEMPASNAEGAAFLDMAYSHVSSILEDHPEKDVYLPGIYWEMAMTLTEGIHGELDNGEKIARMAIVEELYNAKFNKNI